MVPVSVDISMIVAGFNAVYSCFTGSLTFLTTFFQCREIISIEYDCLKKKCSNVKFRDDF